MTRISESSEGAGQREKIGLMVLALPTLLLSLDMSVLYLALPHLSADLHTSSTQQLWITDIYGFMTAGFLVTMGTVGDRVGRRKLLLIGAVGFGAASILAAYAPNAGVLIAARALMGIAGATLMPSTLALISNMFQQPKQRATAIAIWLSCFMGGAALGPVVGGVLLAHFWWGSVFLLGVPVMVVLLIAGPLLLPEYRNSAAGPTDLASVALSLGTILPFIYGIKEIAQNGASAVSLTALAVGLGAGVLFVRRQQSLPTPLLNLQLFHSREFAGALVVLMLAVATQGGVMLFVTQDLQLVQGFSPLRSGVWLLPSSLAMIVGAMSAPTIAQRIRPGTVIASGTAIGTVGYLMLSAVRVDGGLPLLIAGAVIVFFGIGLVGSLSNNLVAGTVQPDQAGSAAALSQTAGDFGISFGIAVMGSIGTVVYRAHLGDGVTSAVPQQSVRIARQNLAGAIDAARLLPHTTGAELTDSARIAFNDGLNVIAIVAAVLTLCLTGLALRTLRGIPPIGQAAPSTADQADALVE
jgi:DHA2 family multidrug resistance protein-like MFS transporter